MKDLVADFEFNGEFMLHLKQFTWLVEGKSVREGDREGNKTLLHFRLSPRPLRSLGGWSESPRR